MVTPVGGAQAQKEPNLWGWERIRKESSDGRFPLEE